MTHKLIRMNKFKVLKLSSNLDLIRTIRHAIDMNWCFEELQSLSTCMSTKFIQCNKNVNFEFHNCYVFVAKKLIILRLLDQILRQLMLSAMIPFSFNFTIEACKTRKIGGSLSPFHTSYTEFFLVSYF